METGADSAGTPHLSEGARFLSRIDPFRDLHHEHLELVAAAMTTRQVKAGQTVLVEGGAPGTELYVVRDGAFEISHRNVALDILSRGAVFGHPSLLTGQAPEFTTRAREDSSVYCIPGELALDILSRTDGVVFVAKTLRDRLIQTARTVGALTGVRARTVRSMLHGAPEFCAPDTPIAAAAAVMAGKNLSAVLVRMPEGLGIVTDVDLRDKVVAARASGDAPVSTIMSAPVHTVGAETLSSEASIHMMEAGVNHLPVLDAQGQVLGVLSASSLMTMDALSPFALRHFIMGSATVEEVAEWARDVPELFVDLVDAHMDEGALMRIVTLLHDAMVVRLLQLSEQRLGPPPVPYAWLAFGSAARSEMTLVSDQDNGLAYADTDDPAVREYFAELAADVNAGLELCDFRADPHGVVARLPEWRMTRSAWRDAFETCLRGSDNERLVRAAISFDFRRVHGELSIVRALNESIRKAPRYWRFLSGLSELATEIRTPLGFRQRLTGPVDIKSSGLLPIQNLARYFAFAAGFTPTSTVDRLRAVEEAHVRGSDSAPSLREAFASMSTLRLQQHANAVRAGHRPSDAIDSTKLGPMGRAQLQEALRVVVTAQRKLPQRVMP
jgi:CBS domain-containing protein